MDAPENLPGLMARCFAYLESQGIGPLELATMSFQDKLLLRNSEMNIPYGGYLDEAVETWPRGVRRSVICYRELEWHLLQPSGSSSSATEAVLPKPDPGERPKRVRGPVMESTDRDQRLQDIWCSRLREELEGCKAPVLATLESSLDPNRAIAMLAGRMRVTTLKLYVTVFQQWRLWLLEAKQIVPPAVPLTWSTTFLLGETNPVGRAYLN